MSKYSINGTTLDNIAAPIMSMRGLTGGLTPEEMGTNANTVLVNVTDALNTIAAKGVDISGMNSDNLAALIAALAKLPALTTPGVAADLRTGKQLIDGSGNIVTGAMPEQAAQTITPGTSDTTIESGRYLTGTQTIKGDPNLVAANIVKGKTIFGVSGSFSGGANVTTGTFTIAKLNSIHTLTHSLGAVPNFAMAILEEGHLSISVYPFFMFNYNNTSWTLETVFNDRYESYDPATVKTTNANITDTQTVGFGDATDSTIKFRDQTGRLSARTYWYMVGVI